MDNASANDVLARTLSPLLQQRYGIHFVPENGQIRCLAHVANLVVQVLLKHLDEVPDDPQDDDYYEQSKGSPFHYDPDDDDELRGMESEEAMREDESAVPKALATKGTEICQETSAVKKVCLVSLYTLFESLISLELTLIMA